MQFCEAFCVGIPCATEPYDFKYWKNDSKRVFYTDMPK